MIEIFKITTLTYTLTIVHCLYWIWFGRGVNGFVGLTCLSLYTLVTSALTGYSYVEAPRKFLKLTCRYVPGRVVLSRWVLFLWGSRTVIYEPYFLLVAGFTGFALFLIWWGIGEALCDVWIDQRDKIGDLETLPKDRSVPNLVEIIKVSRVAWLFLTIVDGDIFLWVCYALFATFLWWVIDNS